MSKTPEQLAEEYGATVEKIPILFYRPEEPCKQAFLAGYKAGVEAEQNKYTKCADAEWIEKANKYIFNRSAWADMIERSTKDK